MTLAWRVSQTVSRFLNYTWKNMGTVSSLMNQQRERFHLFREELPTLYAHLPWEKTIVITMQIRGKKLRNYRLYRHTVYH
jgi:hypothetical protein